MTMRVLLDGKVHVHYGQIYVESEEDGDTDLNDSFGGQTNGLCGAAVPGSLFLITGLHTGHVGFRVELHDGPPPIDDAWEEIVEASFAPVSPEVALVEWGGMDSSPLDLGLDPGEEDCDVTFRVRYCGTGMDAAREQDTLLSGEPLLDRYCLQLWPAPPAPDRVVKQTGETAAYWHGWAPTLPPPAPEER